MSYCAGPPDRLVSNLPACGNYITHRPHISMHAYRDTAAPLYPQSNPAKYAQQFKQPNENIGSVPAFTPVFHSTNTLSLQNPQMMSLAWNYSPPSNISPTCNCPCK